MYYYCDEYAGHQNFDNERISSEGYNLQEHDLVNSKDDKIKNYTVWQSYEYQRDFVLLELSEPDWCVYHAKVATRFMCGIYPTSHIQTARNGERKQYSNKPYFGEQDLARDDGSSTGADPLLPLHQTMVCRPKE